MTYFFRRHNHPCRGLVRRRNRHPHLPWWHTAVHSPCSPTYRAKRGRIEPVDCWKNEERHVQNLLIHSDSVSAGWRYVNQCSTLRCYKRTRCERWDMPGRRRVEMHSGVWHVSGGEQRDTPCETTDIRVQVRLLPVRHVECRIRKLYSRLYYLFFARATFVLCDVFASEIPAVENLLRKFSERQSG